MVVTLTQGPRHHLRVPSQHMGGESSVKGFKGCGLAVGRKWDLFWGSYQNTFPKMPYWDGISPKKINTGWDCLMHAIGVGIESPQPLSTKGRQDSEGERNKNKNFCLEMGSGVANTL